MSLWSCATVSVRSLPTRWVMRSRRSIDGAGEIAVPRDAELGEGLEPSFQLGKLGVLLARVAPPPSHMHGDDDHQHHEREHREAEQREQDKDGVELRRAHPYGSKAMAPSYSPIRDFARSKQEHVDPGGP